MVVSWLNGDVNERKIIHRFIAFLAVSGQLITMVRMKKYFLHPGDLHLIFNLVYSSESFKVRDRISFLFLCPRYSLQTYFCSLCFRETSRGFISFPIDKERSSLGRRTVVLS